MVSAREDDLDEEHAGKAVALPRPSPATPCVPPASGLSATSVSVDLLTFFEYMQ